MNRFGGQRPSDLNAQKFTEGDELRVAVARMFDRLEGKLDRVLLEKLKADFDKSIEQWAARGIFTPEREAAGFTKPVFERDYQPRITPEILAMMEPGAALGKGYGTPIWTPEDMPLVSTSTEQVSYASLLNKALLEAFRGTAGGKAPDTLLIGPDKRVLTAEQVDVNNILFEWDRYAKPGVVHNPQRLNPVDNGGVSEAQLLADLKGADQRTGGVLRLERNRPIMQTDVGKKKMSAIDWKGDMQKLLPGNVSAQDVKQQAAYVLHCLETKGWTPYFYDWDDEANSCIALATETYIPDEGGAGAVAALYFYVRGRRFHMDRFGAADQFSWLGVGGGVRI